MYGGVSRQLPTLRQEHQVEELQNFVPSVAAGVTRRSPFEVTGIIPMATKSTNGATLHNLHFIDRDSGERYVVVVEKATGALRVFDLDGDEKAVTVRPGWAYEYLKGSLRFCTVIDHTFIVNPAVLTEMEEYAPGYDFATRYRELTLTPDEDGDVKAALTLTVDGWAALTAWQAARPTGATGYVNYPYMWARQVTAAFNKACVAAGKAYRMAYYPADREYTVATSGKVQPPRHLLPEQTTLTSIGGPDDPTAAVTLRISTINDDGSCAAPTVVVTAFAEVAPLATTAPTLTVNTISSGASTDVLAPTAWIHCISGVDEGDVTITLDGSTVTITNNDGMGYLATQIKSAIEGLSTATTIYQAQIPATDASTVRVVKYVSGTRSDFTLSVNSDYGDTAIRVFKRSCRAMEQLPLTAHNGDLLVVRGEERDASETWVVHESDAKRWVETVAPGSRTLFRSETMPLVLKRESDGSFTLDAPTWSTKACGNDD